VTTEGRLAGQLASASDKTGRERNHAGTHEDGGHIGKGADAPIERLWQAGGRTRPDAIGVGVITLVLGGARSGKSAVAERLATSLSASVTYLATAEADPNDRDFLERIERHRARRPSTWTTIEAGRQLASHLGAVQGTVLVDALGTWVAAHDGFDADLEALIEAMADRAGDTVVVSEEVGLGVHPSTEIGGRFRDALGLVNQRVADAADRVLLVVAGRVLPLDRSPW
jgi:adenosylcobinamide kinase/adenosylcobinamide-phosphate guanylyltransferase